MKKHTLKVLTAICLIGISMIWYACEKEDGDIGTVEVSFNLHPMTTDLNSSGRISAPAYDLNDADKVIITVKDNDGNPTEYTQYELKVHKMGDRFITKKIVLPLDSYKISEFYILDGLESIIYASPLFSSLLAQNVTNPLPLLFDVTEKQSKAVDVEVISTENLNPGDFGLIRFPLIRVETFQFLINVSELGTDQLLIAELTVTSGDYTYSQELEAIVDNIVTVKDGYTDYVISVDKEGYESFTVTLTNSELQEYSSVPLIVELEKITIPIEGLIAYYPLNGNANDKSGIGNNGTVTNANWFLGGKIGSCIQSSPKGATYIEIPSSPEINAVTDKLTVSAWTYLYGSSYQNGQGNFSYIIAKEYADGGNRSYGLGAGGN